MSLDPPLSKLRLRALRAAASGQLAQRPDRHDVLLDGERPDRADWPTGILLRQKLVALSQETHAVHGWRLWRPTVAGSAALSEHDELPSITPRMARPPRLQISDAAYQLAEQMLADSRFAWLGRTPLAQLAEVMQPYCKAWDINDVHDWIPRGLAARGVPDTRNDLVPPLNPLEFMKHAMYGSVPSRPPARPDPRLAKLRYRRQQP
ncbi:hypothetical protein [Catellatospora sp. NPDC049133]|uniref:hypothetical protein n=1 Tax=Catellatospora sp. NPDC049133 TaxID=3155499 RepID=UPI0033F17309